MNRECRPLSRQILRLLATGAVALGIVACSPAPDLSRISDGFDAPPDTRPARVSDAVARSAFGQSVTQAVETHPQLAASSAGVRAAQARADAEGRAFLPRFSVGATLGSIANGNVSGGFSPVLQVIQLVYDGGAAANRRVAAQARVFETRGSRQEVAAALTLDAVAAWYDLRSARDRLAISRENVRAHERVLAQVQDRADAGAGVSADVLTTRARLATARASEAEAAARVERARAGFNAVFGRPPPRDVTTPPPAPALPADPDDVLLATSPRILGLEARIATAQADLAVAQSQRFPQVQIDGRAQRRGSAASVDAVYDPGAPGSRQDAIRAAEAELEALQAERAALARDILQALSDLRSDQRAGAARVAAARTAVEANRDTVEAAREEFTIGRRSLTGLLDAERDLFNANETLLAAEREVALSGYAALALTGDILDAFAITLSRTDPEASSPAEDDT